MFIDRDGTLIYEPRGTYQVNTLEELEVLPGVIRNLFFIQKFLDYKLVMVTNQDGLGTPSYPRENFDIVQKKLLTTLENESIYFDDIHVDTSLPREKLPTRKPGTAMLKKYMTRDYDLKNSFVIGDRETDIQLARNLGTKAILYNFQFNGYEAGLDEHLKLVTYSWDKIKDYLAKQDRAVNVTRETGETTIEVELELYGSGESKINTGLGFFDHMLDQISRHSGCNLKVSVKGDLEVDEHHTIEDTALALGEAFKKALGDKKGIERYGFLLPMDESLARVAIDFGGRPWLVWDAEFKREKIGDMPTEMFMHFFKSFSDEARCNLNIQASGDNEHHKIEGIFKAFARAVKMAIKKDPANKVLPSTKGKL